MTSGCLSTFAPINRKKKYIYTRMCKKKTVETVCKQK